MRRYDSREACVGDLEKRVWAGIQGVLCIIVIVLLLKDDVLNLLSWLS